MYNKTEIGKRLEEFARSKGSKAELARLLGAKPQMLTKYYKGEITPGKDMQTRLKSIGCDIDWLLYGEDKGKIFSGYVNNPNTKPNTVNNIDIITLEKDLYKEQVNQLQATLNNQNNIIASLLSQNNYFQEKIKQLENKLEAMQISNTETVNDNTATARLDQGSSRTLTIEKIKNMDTSALV